MPNASHHKRFFIAVAYGFVRLPSCRDSFENRLLPQSELFTAMHVVKNTSQIAQMFFVNKTRGESVLFADVRQAE